MTSSSVWGSHDKSRVVDIRIRPNALSQLTSGRRHSQDALTAEQSERLGRYKGNTGVLENWREYGVNVTQRREVHH